jgi:hypothetical protein
MMIVEGVYMDLKVLDNNITGIFISVITLLFSMYKFSKQDDINKKYEDIKYINEQSLKNYSIYIENKHQRLIEVNDSLINALGYVNDITCDLQEKIDYSKYSVCQLEKYVSRFNLNDDEKHSLLSLIHNDRDAAIKRMYYWEDRIRCVKAKEMVSKFRQSILNVRLYISEEHFFIIDSYAINLFELIDLAEESNLQITHHYQVGNQYAKLHREKSFLSKKVNSDIKTIINIMKDELFMINTIDRK